MSAERVGPPCVLVVDDDGVTRCVLSEVLREAGFAVREASTGREGLQRATEFPDLILLDVVLPDISGHEVCRRIKANSDTASIPIFQISAHVVEPEDRFHAMEGWADDYLTKPINPAELLARIRVWLRVKQAADRVTRLQRLTAALSQAATAQEVAAATHDECLAAVGAAGSLIALLEEGGTEFTLVQAAGLPHDLVDAWLLLQADSPNPLAEAVRARGPVVVETQAERNARYPALARFNDHDGSRALVAVPMEVQGRIVGGLVWDFAEDRTFSDQDTAFVVTVAGLCSQALERARLYDAEREARLDAEAAAAALRESEGRLERRVKERTTELLQAQDALQASESRFRAIVENGFDVVSILSRDGTIAYTTPSVVRVGGRTPEEVIGRQALEWSHPDDVAAFQELFDEFLRLPGGSVTVEQRYRHKDGSWRWVEAASTNCLDNPSINGIVCTFHDITEKKAAEDAQCRLAAERDELLARLQLKIERLPIGLTVTGPDLRLCNWNPAAERIFGFTQAEVMGKTLLEVGIVPPSAEEHVESVFQRVLAGDMTAHGTLEGLTRDGRTITCEWYNTPLTRPDGRFDGMMSMVIDVTERSRLEEQYRQSQKMEAIGRLAGGVAHDFNNLLTIVVGSSEIALDLLAGHEDARALVSNIMDAGKRAATLTDQLLTFSRKKVLKRELLDLNAVVSNLQRMLSRVLGEDVELIAAFGPNLRSVHADASQLEQVILNLAVNARDAMPQGGRIAIATKNAVIDASHAEHVPEVPPGSYVLLTVTDTGCGMDARTLAHVFEPFFTTKEPGKGTGLGLATAYGIVNQSGGHIRVLSEPGRGATFEVYLPAVDACPTRAAAAGPATTPTGTETVLLVETEDGVRALTRRMLQQLGYTVLAAANGSEALDRARQHDGPLDLLITDIVMRGIGGRELFETLAASRAGLKVLYVSGQADDAVLRHGVLDDVVAFLSKPFTRRDLAERVRESLDAPAAPPHVSAGHVR